MDDSLEGLVSKVEALHLMGDDVLVLTVRDRLSDDAAARIRFHLQELLPGRQVLVLESGMQLTPLGEHRQLQRIEQAIAGVATALHAVLRLLSEGEEPAEQHTLDGDLFSTRERDQSQPL